MNSALQKVYYLISEFKKYILEEYPNGVLQNEYKLGQAPEDQVKGCIEAAKGIRDFVQFHEEALGTTYITKCQYEVLLQAKNRLN